MAFKGNHPITDAVLFDVNENPIETTVDDGGTRRLAVDTGFPPGQGRPTYSCPSDLSLLIRDYVRDGGSSGNLLVDGSSTPVEFKYEADPTKAIALEHITLLFVANAINLDGATFGSRVTLPNGLLIEIKGTAIGNIKNNEDFFAFAYQPNATMELNNTGPIDMVSVSFIMGGAVVLGAGTSDCVKVTVRDDLTSTLHRFLSCSVAGIKAE